MTDKQIKRIKSIIENKRVKHFGVEIPLTDEQLKEFEKMIKSKYKNPHERVEVGKEYFTIKIDDYEGISDVWECFEDGISTDESRFKNGNYYNSRCFAEQIAMELNLQQKLRKFTYDNGWKDELWENSNIAKYFIYSNVDVDEFDIHLEFTEKRQEIYFKTREIAQRAIIEIILPFMKENPTFKW